ncbi:MAG: hypothetical protein KDB98_01200 [Flavobacteriales bacterium]|nr:hypothetical protein [Flavobacteriales bacterium]
MKLKTVLSYHPLVVSLIEDLSLNHRAEPSTATEFSEFLSSREFDWKADLEHAPCRVVSARKPVRV